MASRSDIEAGAAFVRLYVRDSEMLRGLARLKQELKGVGDTLARWGKDVGKLGLTLSIPFVAGAKAAADFDTQMRMISTMLDDDSHMKRFAQGIKAMAAEFGEATDTLAAGLYDLLGSGVAPTEAMDVLRESIKAAKGGMTDTATSVATLVNVLNAYHIPASRAREVSDMLFMTAKNGVVTFEQLAQYVGAVTATGYAAGLSLDEMGASLATMTRNGLNADLAVTALQNILSEFLNPSKEGAAAARALGVELSTTTLRTKGLAGVMEILKKATPEQLAKIFPDVRGLRGILALRGDFAGFEKDLEAMQKKAGATDAAFEKMAGSMWTQFNRIWQVAIGAGRAIGEALAGPLKVVADVLIPAGQLLTLFLEKNQQLVRIAAGGVLGLLGLSGGLLGLGAAFRVASFMAGQFRFLLMPATMALGAMQFAGIRLRSMLLGLAGSFATAGRQAATQLATMAGGAGRVVLGIGQIGVAAGQAFAARFIATISSTAPVIASSVSSIAIRIPGMLQTAFITARGYASAFVRGFTGELALFTTQANANFNAFGRGVRYVLERIPQYARAIAPQLTASISSGFQQAYSRVQQIASAAANQVRSTWQSVSTTVSTSVSNAFSYVTAQVSSRVSAAASAVVSRISPVLAQVTGAVGARASQAWAMFSSAASSAASRVKAALGPVWPLLRQDIGLVASLARSALGGVASMGMSAANRVMSAWRLAAPRIASALTNSIGGAFARIRALGSSTAGFLGRGAGSLGRGLGGIAAGASGLLGMFGAGAGGMLGMIASAVPQVLLLGSSLTMLLNPATLLIAAIAGGVYAWFTFSESGQKALASIMAVLQPFIDIAKQTVGGIKDAFAAGDIELAGKIALAGLKLVFITGLNEIGKSLGGVFGETLGSIGSKILGGDFKGAWDTALKGMYAAFVEFQEGIVALWTVGARMAADVWKGTVDQISGFLLETSAGGGAAGAVASKILGVDMSEEKVKAELLDRKNRELAIAAKERAIAEWEKEVIAKEAAGDLEGEDGAIRIRADIAREKAELEKLRSGRGANQPDIVEQAKNDARQASQGMVDDFNQRLDNVDRLAQQQTRDAKDAAAAAAVGGSQAGDDAAKKAREELDALTAEAARAKEKKDAEAAAAGGAGGGDIVAPDIAAMRGNASAATFSAAAISGMFGGGGPQEKMASSMDKMYQKMIEEIRMQQRQERILERIEQGIVMR